MAGLARRARSEQTVASALWAGPPALEFGYRDDRFQSNVGARETEVGLAMPMWLPGQRSARQSAAQSEASVAALSEATARLRLAGTVREAVWEIAQLQAEADLARAQAGSLRALAADVDRRVAAGDLARADALAARGELYGAEALQSQAQQRLQAASLQWKALTGFAAIPNTPEPLAEATGPTVVEEHPVLQLANLQVDLAKKRLDLANASKRSPPELIARVRQDVGNRGEAAVNTLGVAIRIPFGTSDRNEPLLAAAVTELEVAEAAESQQREQVMAAVATARTGTLAAERQLEAERSRAAMLRERATLVEVSFRAGDTSLPELLRASTAAAHAEAGFARQQAALGLARARLQQALGLLP